MDYTINYSVSIPREVVDTATPLRSNQLYVGTHYALPSNGGFILGKLESVPANEDMNLCFDVGMPSSRVIPKQRVVVYPFKNPHICDQILTLKSEKLCSK